VHGGPEDSDARRAGGQPGGGSAEGGGRHLGPAEEGERPQVPPPGGLQVQVLVAQYLCSLTYIGMGVICGCVVFTV